MTQYLNTDLDLESLEDLTEMATALETGGLFDLHVTHLDDGRWVASFETERQHEQPAPNIHEMLSAIESLTKPLRAHWNRCTLREFNIGYECGAEQRMVDQGLSA